MAYFGFVYACLRAFGITCIRHEGDDLLEIPCIRMLLVYPFSSLFNVFFPAAQHAFLPSHLCGVTNDNTYHDETTNNMVLTAGES